MSSVPRVVLEGARGIHLECLKFRRTFSQNQFVNYCSLLCSRGSDRTEKVSSITACYLVAGEKTCPRSFSLATAIVLSPVTQLWLGSGSTCHSINNYWWNSPISNLTKICSVGLQLLCSNTRTDGRTDGRTEALHRMSLFSFVFLDREPPNILLKLTSHSCQFVR
jgi:hypothetical protein